MDIPEILRNEKLITDHQFDIIRQSERDKVLSLFVELRLLLYVGVALLSAGAGILIYQNIDTLGHHTIVACISILCAGCFLYCWRHRMPFSTQEVRSISSVFDFVLLLGCLLLLTLEGYLQFQYSLFGERYGLVTIIPTVVFFFVAYFFDHRGVLAMAISGLALWFGITVTPKDILTKSNFEDLNLVYTGLGLALALIFIAWQSVKNDFKKHFYFQYLNFGAHLFFIASIAGLIVFDFKWAFVPIIALASFLFIRYARITHSFYFLLLSTFYAYFTLTYLMIRWMDGIDADIQLYYLYFIFSCGFVIYFFFNYKNFLKSSV